MAMMMMDEKAGLHILNVRLSTDITNWVDSLVDSKRYSSRSEAVRTFIREYVRSRRQ